MSFRLDLQLSAAEGALIRVLGMVERRGFTAQSVQAQRDADGQWQVQLVVTGQRQAASLVQQLHKVHDCLAVSLPADAPATGQAA